MAKHKFNPDCADCVRERADKKRITPEVKKRLHGDGFLCGLAYAAAYLARQGDDTIAAFLLGESGHSVEDFRKAKVDGYDMRVVSKLYRTDSYLQPK